ncbi:MAG: ribose 5-phosphate isomerase B [bacterium]
MQCKGIVIGSDHAGYKLKEYIKDLLSKKKYKIYDVGTCSEESVDYPDYAEKVGVEVGKSKNIRGIAICGSGIGASISVNKIPGIRGALVHNARAARLSRAHNDANVLVLAGRPYNKENVKKIIHVWFKTKFLGGRHARRIKKISKLDK